MTLQAEKKIEIERWMTHSLICLMLVYQILPKFTKTMPRYRKSNALMHFNKEFGHCLELLRRTVAAVF